MRQMVRGNGMEPGETKQQHSREHKKKEKRKGGRAIGTARTEPLQAA